MNWDAGEGAAYGYRQRPRQHGFANAGDVFHQNMAVGDEGRKGLFNYVILADDDVGNVVRNATGDGRRIDDSRRNSGGGGVNGLLHCSITCHITGLCAV